MLWWEWVTKNLMKLQKFASHLSPPSTNRMIRGWLAKFWTFNIIQPSTLFQPLDIDDGNVQHLTPETTTQLMMVTITLIYTITNGLCCKYSFLFFSSLQNGHLQVNYDYNNNEPHHHHYQGQKWGMGSQIQGDWNRASGMFFDFFLCFFYSRLNAL